MTKADLIESIRSKKSCLCVGLDPEMAKLPAHLPNTAEGLFQFLKDVIEATAPYCVAYKPNLAFFEQYGVEGVQTFERVAAYIKQHHSGHFLIADAKRGDIGNTAAKYATAFYDTFNCDAVTVAPYMGKDNVTPFLGRTGKWAVALGLTSNPGAEDLELLELHNGKKVYQVAMEKMASWGSADELMFVVGATRPELLREIRAAFPEYFFLVPGVGAQGGTVEEVMKHGMSNEVGLLINSSRGILYASQQRDFAIQASLEARKLQKEMENYIL